MVKSLDLLDSTFKTFVDSAPVLCLAADLDFITFYVNPYYEKIHHITLEQASGKHIKDIIGEQGFNENLEYYKKTLQGNVIERKGSFIKLDGAIHHYKATYAPIYYGEDIVGITGVVLDITSEVEIEAKNRELEGVKAELTRMSMTDPLTGLFNRNKLDERLEYEMKRHERYNRDFGVIMVDIDFFKNINDKYGHQAGDDVLKEFSGILQSNIRDSDLVGRWGGEEFLIVVHEVNLDNLIGLANKLHFEIEGYNFSKVGNKTASFGLTISKPNESVHELIKRADDALYLAKSSGRNRIEFI